jgi:hypothetical protein
MSSYVEVHSRDGVRPESDVADGGEGGGVIPTMGEEMREWKDERSH